MHFGGEVPLCPPLGPLDETLCNDYVVHYSLIYPLYLNCTLYLFITIVLAIILVWYSYFLCACRLHLILMCVLFTCTGVNNECVYSNSDCMHTLFYSVYTDTVFTVSLCYQCSLCYLLLPGPRYSACCLQTQDITS